MHKTDEDRIRSFGDIIKRCIFKAANRTRRRGYQVVGGNANGHDTK